MSGAVRTSGAVRALRRPGFLASLPPRWRRRLLAATAVVVLLATFYLLWLRDSALVQVNEVTITGLTSNNAERIRASLEAEANEMTTLHVRRERLERAVEGYPVVRALEVSTDFPNGMRIHVLEQRPAAMVESGRSRVPVAADGSVLRGLPIEGSLPVVKMSGALPADRVGESGTLALLRVAGGAPAVLVTRLDAVEHEKERGIVVTLEEGPELVFGSASRARDKWRAATRVLADDASQGASYVDVRLPERPAAGGLAVETIEPGEPALTYPQP